MIITLREVLATDPDRLRVVEDGTVIAVALVVDDQGGPGTNHSIVGVEQADWTDGPSICRKNGDSRYGYILYLPLS